MRAMLDQLMGTARNGELVFLWIQIICQQFGETFRSPCTSWYVTSILIFFSHFNQITIKYRSQLELELTSSDPIFLGFKLWTWFCFQASWASPGQLRFVWKIVKMLWCPQICNVWQIKILSQRFWWVFKVNKQTIILENHLEILENSVWQGNYRRLQIVWNVTIYLGTYFEMADQKSNCGCVGTYHKLKHQQIIWGFGTYEEVNKV